MPGMHDDDFRDSWRERDTLREQRASGTLRWAAGWLIVCVGAAFIAPRLFNHQPGGPFSAAAVPPRAMAKPAPEPLVNTMSFPGDRSGHFLIDADVNGATVRFLVDTGATYVVLTQSDAEAAGVNPQMLTFDQRVATAKGEAHGAFVTLREIRLGQMTQDDVQAMVLDNPLQVSLLGMSFLRRLSGYEIRDGKLILSW